TQLLARRPYILTKPHMIRKSFFHPCRFFLTAMAFAVLSGSLIGQSENTARPRARDIGLKIGILPIGAMNAITDVPGVSVGQVTILKGDNIRTGVTAIVPHGGNLFQEKVPGAIFVGNGF